MASGDPTLGLVTPAAVVKSNPADNYSTHVDTYGRGGYRCVDDIAERDSIVSSNLKEGMVCYVIDISKEYRLTSLAPIVWEEVVGGGTIGVPLILTGDSVEALSVKDGDSSDVFKVDTIDKEVVLAGSLSGNAIVNDADFTFGHQITTDIANDTLPNTFNGNANFQTTITSDLNLFRIVNNANNLIQTGNGVVNEAVAFLGQASCFGAGSITTALGSEFGGSAFLGSVGTFIGTRYSYSPGFEASDYKAFEFLEEYAEGEAVKVIHSTVDKHIPFIYTSGTQSLNATDAVAVTGTKLKVQGDGGAVSLISTPSIEAGSYEGQEITIVGQNSTNTLEIQDESVLAGSTVILQNGSSITLGENENITLFWNGAAWVEKGRSSVKSVFVQADVNSNSGSYRVRNVGGNAAFRFNFNVPEDFGSLIDVRIVFYATASIVAQDIDITSEYSGMDEASNINSESDTIQLTTTLGQNSSYSLASVFSSLEAGDIAGVLIDHQGIGATIGYYGIRLVYNSL